MNPLRKMGKYYSNCKLAAILLFFLFNGLAMAQTTGDTSGVFIFVIDTSSSMENKSFSTSLTVANMVEKGISNRLKDGDVIMVWTYRDKIDTTSFKPIVWKSQDARNISNKIFMYLKDLKYSRNQLKFLSFNYLSTFLDIKKGSTVYIVSDGGKPIDGIPFGAVFMRISQQNYERWKKEKVSCITAIVLENGKINDWAIGETTPSATIKTIAMMEKKVKPLAEIKQHPRKTNENTVVKSAENKELKKTLPQKTNETSKIIIITNVVSDAYNTQIHRVAELKSDTKPLIEKRAEEKVFQTNQVPTKTVTNIVDNNAKVVVTNTLSKDNVSNSVSNLISTVTNKNVIKVTNDSLNSSAKITTNVNEVPIDVTENFGTNYSSPGTKKPTMFEPELKELTNIIQKVGLTTNDDLKNATKNTEDTIDKTNDVAKAVNLVVTQKVAAFPSAVTKSDYSLLRLAIIFGFTASILLCYGYLKYKRTHRHSLITRGMNKGRIYKQ